VDYKKDEKNYILEIYPSWMEDEARFGEGKYMPFSSKNNETALKTARYMVRHCDKGTDWGLFRRIKSEKTP